MTRFRGFREERSRAAHDRARGREWFDGLETQAKVDLGDAFVLDTFDWTEWLHEKPSRAFLDGAEEARLYWEEVGE